MILIIGLLVDPIVWVVLRVISGFCLAGLYMVIESWLNEKSTNDNRGQIFAFYMVINLSAVTLGQMTLPAGDPVNNTLFVVTGITILLALVPVSLTTSAVPAPIAEVRLRLTRLYRMSPVGILGCFFVGMANGAYGGMGAVFGQKLAFSVLEVSLFMSASLIGGALAQVPIGRLSDKFDRRAVMIGVCAGAAVIDAILAFAGGFGDIDEAGVSSISNTALIILVGVLGCFIYTMYALCVAHTNDFISSQDFVEASSGLLLTYGIGATIGPFLAAVLMQILGVGALFVFTAVIHLLFLCFALYRMTRRAAVPAEEREHFVQTAAPRTTPAVIALDPRCPDSVPETNYSKE
jgi:MFS family permease